jgi:hypothetical protein
MVPVERGSLLELIRRFDLMPPTMIHPPRFGIEVPFNCAKGPWAQDLPAVVPDAGS